MEGLPGLAAPPVNEDERDANATDENTGDGTEGRSGPKHINDSLEKRVEAEDAVKIMDPVAPDTDDVDKAKQEFDQALANEEKAKAAAAEKARL